MRKEKLVERRILVAINEANRQNVPCTIEYIVQQTGVKASHVRVIVNKFVHGGRVTLKRASPDQRTMPLERASDHGRDDSLSSELLDRLVRQLAKMPP